MGAFSTRNFERRNDIEGQGKEVLLHAKSMHMTNYHLHRLYHEFNKLAGDSGLVDLDEFFMFYKIDENVLLYFLFQQFEITKRGSLNFDQYLVTLWNLLTMQHDEMAVFMYTAFNPTELSSIDIDEIKYMIKVLYRFPKKPPRIMKEVFKKLSMNKNGVITLVEWVLLSRHHKALFQPFHDLKKMIRKHVVHTRYWREQAWKRKKYHKGKSIYEIIQSWDPIYVKMNLEWLSTCKNTPPEEVAIWKEARARQDKQVIVDVYNIPDEHLTPYQLSGKTILGPPPVIKRRFAITIKHKIYKSRYYTKGGEDNSDDGESDYEDTDNSEMDNISELSAFSGNSNSRFSNAKQKLKKNKRKGVKHSEHLNALDSVHDDNDEDSKTNDDTLTTRSATLNKENLLRKQQQQQQNDNNINDDNNSINEENSLKEEKSDLDERSFSSKKGYFGGKAIFPILKPINI